MVVDDEVGWRMEWMSLIWLLMVDDVVGSTRSMEWIISSLLELVMWLYSGSSASSRQLNFEFGASFHSVTVPNWWDFFSSGMYHVAPCCTSFLSSGMFQTVNVAHGGLSDLFFKQYTAAMILASSYLYKGSMVISHQC
jgi:hypothetical protein